MLRVSGLEGFYGASQALFGMDFAIDAGEVVTLMGRNGMGKTTTVHAIMGLLPARRGTVEFEGKRVDHLPAFRIARAGLAIVPEGRQVFRQLTVLEHLQMYAFLNAGLEIYNALNANDATGMSFRSGPTYGQITAILPPRVARFGMSYAF